ncbi:MAG TPA: TIGR00730 family Rossman fold protein [Chitinophagaceae bacterium]
MQATIIRSLAVFCGSKSGVNPLFTEHAIQLGKIFVENNITLIYGGGSVGIMGTIADAVMQHGGKATGVIPQVLVDWERQHNSLSELIVVDDMHSRKKKMYELCDAAIILPGGFGTLDELFEMVTWNQLSIHDKQIFILNSGGFYDHLITHIEQMSQEKFLYEEAQKRLTVIHEPSNIIALLK